MHKGQERRNVSILLSDSQTVCELMLYYLKINCRKLKKYTANPKRPTNMKKQYS